MSLTVCDACGADVLGTLPSAAVSAASGAFASDGTAGTVSAGAVEGGDASRRVGGPRRRFTGESLLRRMGLPLPRSTIRGAVSRDFIGDRSFQQTDGMDADRFEHVEGNVFGVGMSSGYDSPNTHPTLTRHSPDTRRECR